MSDLGDKIRGWSLDLGDQVDQVIVKVALSVWSRLIVRSPVLSGRFRSSWRYDDGYIVQDASPVPEAAAGEVIPPPAPPAVEVKGARFRHILIANNLPYAWPLEHGHSPQAPAGIVGPTLHEAQQIVDEAVASVRSAGSV